MACFTILIAAQGLRSSLHGLKVLLDCSGVADMAIFCLSLMGTNYEDFVREASRCLPFSLGRLAQGAFHNWITAVRESLMCPCCGFCSVLNEHPF